MIPYPDTTKHQFVTSKNDQESLFLTNQVTRFGIDQMKLAEVDEEDKNEYFR